MIPVTITWERFLRDVETLGNALKGQGITKILAITKGGLIPAYFIAKILDIDYIDTACVSSYDEEKQRDIQVKKIKGSRDDGWLIIDDLVDSGATLRLVKQLYPKAITATLYIKKDSPFSPTYYVDAIDDGWVIFPWED